MTGRKNFTIISLYALLIVCMGISTIIVKLYGEDFASANIYGSWWFISLWAILVFVALLYLVQWKVYRRVAVMTLHLSFVVILVGALITHFSSESGSVHLRKGGEVSSFIDKDGIDHKFPFALAMTDFEVLNYPGTDAVMDYCSRIEVKSKDKTEQISVSQISVSMNNIGKVDGYRFYQSAYDSDYEGTSLLVSYDPYGIAITYIGYILLLISLLWTIFSKQTRIRELYRKAIKPVAVLLLLFATPNIKAQEKIPSLNKEIADEIGNLAVRYNGRICPLNTAAVEFVTKLSGKGSWNGYSANEIFVGWMIYYTQWETQKIIKVKSVEVRKILGIADQWASVRDFYTSNHKYKLSGKANDTKLPASTRKAIREVDEKLQVVAMFYNSEMLHIFPLTVEGKMDWYTPGSTELPLGTPEAEFQFINHAMDNLTKSVLVNDVAQAKQTIAKIRLYQKEKATEVMPSASMLRFEVFYNNIQQARWIVFMFLTLSLILGVLMLVKNNSKTIKIVHIAFLSIAMIWLTSLLIMRWIISGHVPMSNGFETMLFMSWIALVISLLSIKRLAIIQALAPIVSGFCMLVATLAVGSPQITNLMPVLQSPLLTIHVALVMISYALFAIITLMAVYGLVLDKKQMTEQLESITALSTLLLYPAVALIAMGIFIGAVWANVSWGCYWSWDPKETWALITLMIYSVPLHRSFVSLSPSKYHLYILLSFLAVLMTYFGVNYFLPGMHSYA